MARLSASPSIVVGGVVEEAMSADPPFAGVLGDAWRNGYIAGRLSPMTSGQAESILSSLGIAARARSIMSVVTAAMSSILPKVMKR